MAVRAFVATLLVSPYLPNAFPALALLGVVAFWLLAVGFLLAAADRPRCIAALTAAVLRTELPPQPATFLAARAAHAAARLADQVHRLRVARLHERLWARLLLVVRDHARQYRRVRRALLRDSLQPTQAPPATSADPAGPPPAAPAAPASPPRHLDDFNDFADATDAAPEDPPLASAPDDLNTRICMRMAAIGMLHPAVAAGRPAEAVHLRALVDRILDNALGPAPKPQPQIQPPDSPDPPAGLQEPQPRPSSASLMRILIRELVVCRFAAPVVQRFSQPHVLNQLIIDKSQYRIITDRTVKAFRLHIDSLFVQFPPVFLLPSRARTTAPSAMPRSEKQRYCEMLSKYSRTARSIIDVKAVRHEISRELRRVIDDIRDNPAPVEAAEDARRYIRALETLKLRTDRRIAALAAAAANAAAVSGTAAEGTQNRLSKRISMPIVASLSRPDRSDRPDRPDTTESKPPLALQSILDEYAGSSTDPAAAVASSLYYFLDFLERRDGGAGIAKLRFWLAAEKFQRTRWSLTPGASWREAQHALSDGDMAESADLLPASVHDRLRRDALRIYRAFLAAPASGAAPPVVLPADVLAPVQRYVAPLLGADAPMPALKGIDQGQAPSAAINPSDEHACIELAQRAVRADLEEIFKEFLHSESFFRWSSERERARLTQRDRAAVPSATPAAAPGLASAPGTTALAGSTVTAAAASTMQDGVLGALGASLNASSAGYSHLATFGSGGAPSFGLGPLAAQGMAISHSGSGAASAAQTGMGSLQDTQTISASRTSLLEVSDDAKARQCSQSALVASLTSELDNAVMRLTPIRRPTGTRSDKGTGQRVASVTARSALFDADASGVDFVMLDDAGAGDAAGDFVDDPVAEHGRPPSGPAAVAAAAAAAASAASAARDLDDDADLRSPGELLASVTKLQQVRDDIDKVMIQIECVELLQWRIRSDMDAQAPQPLSPSPPTATAASSAAGTGAGDPSKHTALHILDRTKDLLHVEIGELTRKRAKYESQEQREAIVPGQCTVRIQSSEDELLTPREDASGLGGRVTFYLIQIERVDRKVGWTVRRRYNDFDALHRRLRDEFPIVAEFEFPGKGLGLFSLGKHDDLRRTRMVALEKYLQRLVDNPVICQSDHLRDFLASTFQSVRRKGIFRAPYYDPARGVVGQRILAPAGSSLKRKSRNVARKIAELAAKPLRAARPAAGDAAAGGAGTSVGPVAQRKNIASLFDSRRRRWRRGDAGAVAPASESSESTDLDSEGSEDTDDDGAIADTAAAPLPADAADCAAASSLGPRADAFGGGKSVNDLSDTSDEFVVAAPPGDTGVASAAGGLTRTAQPAAQSAAAAGSDGSLSDDDSPVDLANPVDPDAPDADPLLANAVPQALADPLCALLVELFEFGGQSTWMRRNTAAMIVAEVFGAADAFGGNDRKISQWLMDLVRDDSLVRLLDSLRMPCAASGGVQPAYRAFSEFDAAPVGSVPGELPPRRAAVRAEARAMLVAVLPDIFVRVLGQEAATRGATRCFDMLQCEALNKHLILSLLDAAVELVLSEV
ncbi:hypothetical protein HK105_205642 [Polyrhizophydium stewartii]|uniref:PX domain-containing protein n=1 Tax=Polyrhizophydium stewartii TaxID=2732419 RepID=A0ABR4N5S0_9FUNG